MQESFGDERGIPKREHVAIDRPSYRSRAEALYREHEDELRKDEDEGSLYNERDIGAVLHQIPDDVLRRYAGHGVVRGTTEGNIAVALSFLESGIIIGDVAPLKADGYLGAYRSGEFFIISHRGGFTGPAGKGVERVSVTLDDKEVSGLRVEMGALVCNLTVDSLVEALRAQYPEATILHASELVDYIQKEENAATRQKHR